MLDSSPKATKPVRSVWGRSITLAIGLHLTVLAGLFVSNGTSLVRLSPTDLAPIAESQLVKQTTAQEPVSAPLSASVLMPTPTSPSKGSVSLAIEPPSQVVRDMAQTILAKAAKPAGPDGLQELRRQAATLSQISTPQEVARISQEICKALDAKRENSRNTSAESATGFDFNQALVKDSQRIERENLVEIREKLTDPAGKFVTLVFRRMIDPLTGQIVYTQGMIEDAANEPVWSDSDQEVFETAEARQRPFAVIDQFPLVRQIHEQAVLPLLQKLSEPGK